MDEEQRQIAIRALNFMLVALQGSSMIEFSCALLQAEGVFRGSARYGEGQGFMRLWGPDVEKHATADDNHKLVQLFEACKVHGEQSEPDHEVGDLRNILRFCWDLLGPVARTEVYDTFHDIREVWRKT
jgi:hypothetical protein